MTNKPDEKFDKEIITENSLRGNLINTAKKA
jgi:hypothetical protein